MDETASENVIQSIADGHREVRTRAWKSIATFARLYSQYVPKSFGRELFCYLKTLWGCVRNNRWILGIILAFSGIMREWIYYHHFEIDILDYYSDFSITTTIAIRVLYATAFTLGSGTLLVLGGILVYFFLLFFALSLVVVMWMVTSVLIWCSRTYFATICLLKRNIRSPMWMNVASNLRFLKFTKICSSARHMSKGKNIRKVILRPISVLYIILLSAYVIFIEPRHKAITASTNRQGVHVVLKPSQSDETRQYLRIGAVGDWVFLMPINDNYLSDTHSKSVTCNTHNIATDHSFGQLLSRWFDRFAKSVHSWISIAISSISQKNHSIDCTIIAVPFTRVCCSFSGEESNGLPDSCSDCAANDPPKADAGPDRTVREGDDVVLDGSRSRDPSGRGLIYKWTAMSEGVSLSNDSVARPTFRAPEATNSEVKLLFRLVVTDQSGATSDSDEVTITVVGNLMLKIITSYSRASHRGGPITLTWATTSAKSVEINNGIGFVGPRGELDIGPSGTDRAYTVTAKGHGGQVSALTQFILRSALPQFEPIYFCYDCDEMDQSADPRLAKYAQELAQYLKVNPNREVLVLGHTDERGPSRYNWALGRTPSGFNDGNGSAST